MLYQYKEAFSLGDEIGTCPNIEVGIEVMDKSPFFIRPFHIREEDKKVIDKEMRQLCYLGILKEGFLSYSSPVMLISCKLIQDKRVVTDFRHLNDRIAKTNLAYPLVRDTGKEILQYITIFWECFVYLSKNTYGIKYIPFHLAIIHKCNFRLFGI